MQFPRDDDPTAASIDLSVAEPLPLTGNLALTVEEIARSYYKPAVSKQTVYRRLIWSGKVKVLDLPGPTRVPLSELKKFFGKVRVYEPRRKSQKRRELTEAVSR
jgi:hypothetical protein